MNGPPVAPVGSCRCGHDEDAHQHYREGSDCCLCACETFEQPGDTPPISPELRRLLAVTLGAPLGLVVLVALGTWLGPAAVAAALAVICGTAVCLLIRERPHDHDDEDGG